MGKIVQVELDEREYRQLLVTSEKIGIAIEKALREAIIDWVRDREQLSEDPIFRLKPKNTGVKTDSSKLDEQLYRERP
ncbi:MAG: hypothetical protein Q8O47_06245 [Candidatus Bathyarchaeota archaeon]|nr:hypothetical protein [Candidatus Bathyarchaeota archaeon]